MIKVVQREHDSFVVTVQEGTTTTHHVMLTDDYYQCLTKGVVDKAILIKKSFQFLLERESNTSILPAFELPVIQQYFPEYEQTIRQWAESR